MASSKAQKTEAEDDASPLRDAAIAVGAVAAVGVGAVAIGGLGLLVGGLLFPVYTVLQVAELVKDTVVAVANAEPAEERPFYFDQRAADVEYARRGSPGGLVLGMRMEEIRKKYGY